MPYSSGGGCSGGGYHGGHGNSSHPLNRYWYHTPRGIKTILAEEEPTEEGLKKYKLHTIVSIIILSFVSIALLLSIYLIARPRHKLPLPKDSKSIVVDNLNLLTDGEKISLLESCDNFRDKTGIPVAIYIDSQDIIYKSSEYPTLQDFAYDYYIKTFNDEKHWLLVYTKTNDDEFGIDWRFEGMQGNDTGSVLTTSNTDKFNKEFDKNLDNKLSVSDSFIKALDHAPTYMIGKWNLLDANCVFTIMFAILFIISTCVISYQRYHQISKMKEYLTDR